MHITKLAEANKGNRVSENNFILKVNSHNGEAIIETQYNVLIVL